ncbi:MAG: hypothetical protein IKF97_00720 [Clostridia bacterium]|nr:hypothetical protein [Clostridia bacterium]
MNLNKIITVIVVLVITAGIVVTLTAGLNVDMKSKEHDQVLINIDKQYNMSDIMDITKEVFEGKTVDNQKAGENNKQVLISASTITEEEKTNLITKINEKFGTELNAEDIEITVVPRVKISSSVSPYIFPIILTYVLVLVYSVIRYKKLGVLKVIAQYVLGIIVISLLTFSLIAITRAELGTVTLATLFTDVALSIVAMTSIFESKLKNLKLSEQSTTEK